MSFRRGQAAMEYLMTYGWAILVIVIVLAALLYLGIFNLDPPEVCTMPAGMTCPKSYLSSAADQLNVTLVNGLQKSITITNVTCTKDPSNYSGGWAVASQMNASLGQAININLKCADELGLPLSFDVGDSLSARINVQYYFKDEGINNLRRISGNVFAKAG
ncbi:MAG: hypothetical protein ABIG39_02015 [Candidatus Micrarchaeota archaeon]